MHFLKFDLPFQNRCFKKNLVFVLKVILYYLMFIHLHFMNPYFIINFLETYLFLINSNFLEKYFKFFFYFENK